MFIHKQEKKGVLNDDDNPKPAGLTPRKRDGHRNRKPDHCKRCGVEGRRRNWQNKRHYNVYACKECLSMTDGKAALLKIRRENIGIIWKKLL